MNKTQSNLIRLYSDILDYVNFKRQDFGLTPEEAEDLVTDAYLKARRKLSGVAVRKDRKRLIKEIAWSSVISTLRELDKQDNAVLDDAVRLDAEVNSSDGSDSRHLEVANLNQPTAPDAISAPELPDWETMTKERVERLRGDERKVATQLKLPYSSYANVMRETGLSRYQFYKILKKLKVCFDQCFQAYHECLAAEFEARYQLFSVYNSGEKN